MNITARTTHPVVQGTGPWLRLREGFFTASEAPAALGVSRYVTRAELLRRKHTGIAEEHSQTTLAKFRAGHAAEADARPLVEDSIGLDLFPVTMSCEVDGLRLLASLDGITMDETIVWETKLWNEELAAAVRAGTLPAHYTVQMDQELLVSGADRCLFSCTDGTPERFVSCWYEADPAKFAALVAGWHQFERDLAAYAPAPAAEPAPVGKAPETLPALHIEVTGKVTASNLAEFKATALAAIRSVNRELRTDADFADAERAVKWFGDVEGRIAAAKEHALSQTASIDALFKALDDITAESKRVRLDLDKLVTRRKTEVKEDAISSARRALDAHIAALNAEIAPMRVHVAPADFAGAIKGKRSIASMQDALDTTLAGAKIAADGAARLIRTNAAVFRDAAAGLEFLFSDLGAIISKPADDFALLVKARVDQHRAAEAERERKRVEAENARIAAEAQRMADEQVRKALEAERQRQAAEAAAVAALQAASAPVATHVAAPAPQAAPAPILRVPEPVASADEPANLLLGAICARLGFTLSAAFLAETLHINPARTDKAARYFTERQFALICARLTQHIAAAAQREAVAA